MCPEVEPGCEGGKCVSRGRARLRRWQLASVCPELEPGCEVGRCVSRGGARL